VIKRTSINLDLDLVAEAKAVLGTVETTETIHRALDEVVRQQRIRRLLSRRFEAEPREQDWLRRPKVGVRASARRSRVGTR
jgi:Arc/MetJ family transcription regulator